MFMLTTLNFLKDIPLYDVEQPYELFGFPNQEAAVQTNFQREDVSGIELVDCRENIEDFTFDKQGFTFLRHPSACELTAEHFEHAKEDDGVVARYLNETCDLVKNFLGAIEVICFDWRFRRNAPSSTSQPIIDKHVRNHALPVADTIHCDFSYDGGRDRLELHLLKEELEAIDSGKFEVMIMNAWRPLFLVENAPMVFSDRRTISKKDLIEVDKVLPDKVEKGFFAFHRPGHKWYYLSKQTSDEIALFPSWRPKQSGTTADCCPHGACERNIHKGTRPRESIEVRMICLKERSIDQ